MISQASVCKAVYDDMFRLIINILLLFKTSLKIIEFIGSHHTKFRMILTLASQRFLQH
jgi:hypothetical protein